MYQSDLVHDIFNYDNVAQIYTLPYIIDTNPTIYNKLRKLKLVVMNGISLIIIINPVE